MNEANTAHGGGHRRAALLGSASPLGSAAKPPVLDGYITLQQLADELGIGIRTLARWRALGEGPPVTRLGRQLLYRRSSVEAWLTSLEQDA